MRLLVPELAGEAVPAACGTDAVTGYGWTYPAPVTHIAATTWYLFAEFEHNPFWGISTAEPIPFDPTKDELRAVWTASLATLTSLATRYSKPIIVTEIGYRSVDGATRAPWNFASGGEVDLQEQADASQVVLESFCSQPRLSGINWWVWSPWPEGDELDIGFTPRGKPAEGISREYDCTPPDLTDLPDEAFSTITFSQSEDWLTSLLWL